MFIKRVLMLVLFGLLIFSLPSAADADKVYIDITASGVKRLPIAIQNFVGASEISDIIKADLTFTGLFECIEEAAQIEKPTQPFNAASWRGLGVEMVVKGFVKIYSSSAIEITITAHDVADGREVLRKDYSGRPDSLRTLAHYIANDIYKQLTGANGIFLSRIAFVNEKAGAKQLYIMDFDGDRMVPLPVKAGILLAPRWSPDNSKLLFSAEKGRKWGIYVYDIRAGREYSATSLSGLGIAGGFYPDSRRFLFSASRDGKTNIMVGNIGGSPSHPLITSPWIDVSPSLSPDAYSIVFVSNRTGNPQVYISDNQGYGVRRLTFEGNYNTAPAWSPLGDRIVYTSMIGGRNQLFTIKPDGTGLTQLTFEGNNEDPVFSPDGRYIVFSSTREGAKGLFVIRLNGEGLKRLTPKGFRSASPGWSAY